jgi:hypothetical protein
MIHISASSPCLARVCPRSSNALPSALLSAKFSLQPNVVKAIFILGAKLQKKIQIHKDLDDKNQIYLNF